ncbi:bifunctional [glutamine synthetase] adenylyltransferase/[glutamine synthetase]-adenylyl-L-tyrosine phosphorylase [Stakelama saccharophila]|uniref:Bifunctional [glutamine synthetase] adenylyltransferase/[glutamine synthetase]-adenylyl-L-tyrosine phosphorylase n=1 Tax=Stakelama saccharophila TaxID=3075605 RepID=A0ABZ0BCJ8_9SPHN|nr:bifunctional [glutamine synthetase] adenylyltransferase/[glutamine synthetase]-adenylyl-L-tyrosine phosphorylase [Stakelama sp. W311]WNO54917.1 bifunctional [glutamine synthetase] adenylyltransferase/[glutamine synthetase]-adenylyl-L-tyrosine phosphorylase [Stakelama sp. W311]
MIAPDLQGAIDRAEAHSPFLSGLLRRESALLDRLDSALDDPLAAIAAGPDAPTATRLRVERRRLALLTALGDLSGRYSFERTTRLLSDFADDALDRAIRAAIAERTPDAEPVGMTAVALGKQGSRELNYSSDIDPILLYDPQRLPTREREAPEDAANRIARRVLELLQTLDGDGYVLRVDLRLRPQPEATPIALPVNAAIAHYESQALPWERTAFIRARTAAGDRALGDYFLDAIQGFIWRRSLDFGAIGEIMAITKRIRDHYAQGQAFGPGYDLKRGRGGIREIEFFAQVHQLIHGGRDPELRAPATLDALAALGTAGWIGADAASALADAYRLLRTIEHRVQMLDDRQEHALPQDAERLADVAGLHGCGDADALLDLLRPHVERAGREYDALDEEEGGGLPRDATGLEHALRDKGFADSKDAVRLIGKWRAATYPALRSSTAQSALEGVLPALVDAMAQAADPRAALLRFDAVVAGLPSAINFLRLLEAEPALAKLLSTILCHAPTLAAMLGRRVELLDGLIDASALDPVGDVETLIAAMAVPPDRDYQDVLDHVRRFTNEQRFALGAQIVSGASDPLSVSAGYARLAEAAIGVLADASTAEFAQRHGHVPGSELLILALGRLGGAALTHASDLDLIYVFTGDHRAESDGDKPLGAVTYYNRLAQRITAALSVPTAAGPLYEVDTRLRPSGAQGPLSVSLDGFAAYQRDEAWTWEHMALTRARPVYGSAAGRQALGGIIQAVLDGGRTPRDIAGDAVRMRRDMALHKPPLGPLDAKLLDGGLVDLEFAVHVRQLIHRQGFDPHLGRAIEALVAADLLPAEMLPAYDFLTRLLVVLRLVAPDAQPPAPATRGLVADAVGAADWDAVLETFERTRQQVRACWQAVENMRTEDEGDGDRRG